MKKPATTPDDYSQTVSLGRLARRWGLPRRQVRRLVQTGRLPFVQVMGRIRVPAGARNPGRA